MRMCLLLSACTAACGNLKAQSKPPLMKSNRCYDSSWWNSWKFFSGSGDTWPCNNTPVVDSVVGSEKLRYSLHSAWCCRTILCCPAADTFQRLGFLTNMQRVMEGRNSSTVWYNFNFILSVSRSASSPCKCWGPPEVIITLICWDENIHNIPLF